MNETARNQPHTALPRLEPLELASGMILGRRRSGQAPREGTDQAGTPLEAFEALVLPALRRPPCLVAFSGGRDSSAVLAATADVARRHGLDLPVACTLRFGDDPRTDESDWQELVVRHLELPEWLRIEQTTELDALGSIGAGSLERFGAYWPPLAHTWVPLFDAAGRGSVLGGNGGDEFLSPWRPGRIWLMQRGRLRPTRSELKVLALFCMPARIRAAIWRRRIPATVSWLTPAADDAMQKLWAIESTMFERDWQEHLEWTLDSRYFELARASFDAFAQDAGVLLVEPFREAPFVRAVGRCAPRSGFASREQALRRAFGDDLLPPEALARTTKAAFTNVPWGPASRAFAAEWDGTGADADYVDVERLRAEWLSERPDFRSLTALQSAWLAAQPQRR